MAEREKSDPRQVLKADLEPLAALPDGLALTVGGLAELLGVSVSVLNDRTSRGLLERSGRNRFLVAKNVRLYCDELRAAAGRHGAGHRDPAKVRLTEGQARLVELKVDQAEGRLLDAIAVEREWTSLLRGVRAELLAVPSRIGARLGLGPADVVALDHEIRAALESLASPPADPETSPADLDAGLTGDQLAEKYV